MRREKPKHAAAHASKTRIRLGGRHTWILALPFCLGTVCGPEPDDAWHYRPETEQKDAVSDHAEAISVVSRATVPQGRWTLHIGGGPYVELDSRTVLTTGSIKDIRCDGANEEADDGPFLPCQYALELDCPRNSCDFEFALSATRDPLTDDAIHLTSAFVFDVTDGGGAGCEERDPEYVEPEDRQRFFKATFDVLEVLLCADDAQPPGDARARAQSVHTVACDRLEHAP